MKFFSKIPKKNKTRKKNLKYKPKIILLAERPDSNIIKKINYALFDKKNNSRLALKRKLEKQKIFLFFIMEHSCFTKANRISDIEMAYSRIKANMTTEKVIILYNYIEDGVGKKLRQDFPKKEFIFLEYTPNYEKFKKKLLKHVKEYIKD